jgi:hypothetical protein
MTKATTTTPASWRTAAGRLARRVERRGRAGAALPALAAGTAAGALACAAAGTLLGAPAAVARAALVASAGAGLVAGAVRAARAPRVSRDDAAWALDRLAGARERGLAAATLPEGPAAQAASGLPAPPRVRLAPPRGVAALASAALLATLAWTLPFRARSLADEPTGVAGASVRGPGAGAGAGAAREAGEAEARAEDLARRSREVAAARDAIGLPPEAPLDPERVAEILSSPEALEAARRAAPALAAPPEGGPAAPDAVARALARALASDPASEAEALRREAAARRAAAGAPVPAHRRATVAEYFARRARGAR